MLLSTVTIAMLLSACGLADEDKARLKEYENTAETNAVQYVENKYGIKIEVVDINLGQNSGSPIPFAPSHLTGEAYVKMKDSNGKKFTVYTDADKESNECYDNYQKEEIMEGITKAVTKYVGVPPKAQKVSYGIYNSLQYEEENQGLVNGYFDGSNLKDVLHKGDDNSPVNAVFEFTGVDNFNSLKNIDLPGKNNDEIYFFSYKDEKSMNFVKDSYAAEYDIFYDSDVYARAVYMKRACLLNNEGVKQYKTDVKESNGIYYLNLKNDDNLKIEKTDSDDISNWDGRGILKDKAKIVSESYSVPDGNKVYIYFPKSKLDGEYKRCIVGETYINGDEKCYQTNFLENIGDYLVFEIDTDKGKDEKFNIIVTKD